MPPQPSDGHIKDPSQTETNPGQPSLSELNRGLVFFSYVSKGGYARPSTHPVIFPPTIPILQQRSVPYPSYLRSLRLLMLKISRLPLLLPAVPFAGFCTCNNGFAQICINLHKFASHDWCKKKPCFSTTTLGPPVKP
jgi:hypothetical protein